jgi:hypothetical protein
VGLRLTPLRFTKRGSRQGEIKSELTCSPKVTRHCRGQLGIFDQPLPLLNLPLCHLSDLFMSSVCWTIKEHGNEMGLKRSLYYSGGNINSLRKMENFISLLYQIF